ncbi:hypothetical protein MTR67_002287 [Solanum verrucosum]|uniref:Tf2-1-like SH3-like domain-containing protein n=1 Tax=Solanum verrucosum TaxID=315347 RepID=A0AAF0T5S0_SOLVR|nr:hypothetical protein MTR67_002287 [Solanum verrucosum]
MKKDISKFIAKCHNYQQVKVEHKYPEGLSQDIRIPTWKCEDLNMDFGVHLLCTHWQYDLIWVMRNRIEISAHFIPIKVYYSAEDYAKLYWREMVSVKRSTTFHPKIDGKVECTIQTLDDMLRACVIELKGKVALIYPELVHKCMEKVSLIRERLKMTQTRKNPYDVVRRRDLEFYVHDWVYLNISPMNGVMRFGKKGKLSPCYVGPHKILRRIGEVAYELDFPNDLASVHPVSHVSLLNKCVGDLHL